MSAPPTAGSRFRAALAAERPLQVVGAVNAYAALLAERAADMVLRCGPTIPLPAALGGEVDADVGVGAGGVDGGRDEVDVSAVVAGADGASA